jgi:hypothetical protein
MGRSRKKQTQTDTPLFWAITQFNGENPATEAEMQATVDRLQAEGRMPSQEQWEAIKHRLEAELRKGLA